ncbi:MAG: ATP-binding cassette domain-containing protein [Clostridiales bacterium]|jgi:oligopeptide transport system ATP-binding protein|nr:ATP-binding cassette domain-containing protein [Clostridiales bacterium]
MNTDLDDNKTVLRVNNLKQYFKRGRSINKAVDGISFDIKKGEVFGLVGESGCGKTTTGRAVIGLYKATGGDVYLHDRRIIASPQDYTDSVDIEKARSDNKLSFQQKSTTAIQMIFQDPISSLNPRMNVFDIIAEGLIIRGIKDRDLLKQKVFQTLELVGLLQEHASRYPHEFSGGQRQRIGIARAIILEPEVLIADEPVSALDVSIQAQVINLMNDLRKKVGLTILFIAHNLSVVKYFSDRIAVMYMGKIVEQARTEQLFAKPCHPYTRALISAIPYPDPLLENQRQRIVYNPLLEHNYAVDKPYMRELEKDKGHYVYCNDIEYAKIDVSFNK